MTQESKPQKRLSKRKDRPRSASISAWMQAVMNIAQTDAIETVIQIGWLRNLNGGAGRKSCLESHVSFQAPGSID
jgi:hypothetical protein